MIRSLFLIIFSLALLTLAAEKSEPSKYCGQRAVQMREFHSREISLDNIYESTDVPKSIPDGPNGVATSVLNIPDDIQITDLNLTLTIEHTWIRDLRITLIAPFAIDTSGDSSALLIDLYPGDDAVNMTATTFDDEAAHSINDTAFSRPPFSGVFRPLQSLSRFDGHSAQGDWILRVQDRFHLDTGRVVSWAIDLNPVLSLQGVVINAHSNNPIIGAHVDVVGANRQAVTDTAGHYGISGLVEGNYSVIFSSSFYDTLTYDSVGIVAGQTTALDAALNPQVDSLLFTTVPPAVQIHDISTDSMRLSIAPSFTIEDIMVTVNITHSYVGDLSITLRSPSGTEVGLIHHFDSCYSIGANIINCVFDDNADSSFHTNEAPYVRGVAPFTGNWRPFSRLSGLRGQNTYGDWYLKVTDYCEGDFGTINNFSLRVTPLNPVSVDNPEVALPQKFSFEGNYPNPFNNTTTFAFSLPQQNLVSLKLYDILGREAAQIGNDFFSAGEHRISYDAASLPSGLYFAQFHAGDFSETRKIVLLK